MDECKPQMAVYGTTFIERTNPIHLASALDKKKKKLGTNLNPMKAQENEAHSSDPIPQTWKRRAQASQIFSTGSFVIVQGGKEK